MQQIRYWPGRRPGPHWGSLQRCPSPLAGLRNPTSKVEGRRGKEKGEKGNGKDQPPLRKFLDPPLSKVCFQVNHLSGKAGKHSPLLVYSLASRANVLVCVWFIVCRSSICWSLCPNLLCCFVIKFFSSSLKVCLLPLLKLSSSCISRFGNRFQDLPGLKNDRPVN